MPDYFDNSYNDLTLSTRYRNRGYSEQIYAKILFLFILFTLLLFYSVANYIISYDYNFLWFYPISIILTLTTGSFLFFNPPPQYKILNRIITLVVFSFTIYWLFKNPIKFE